MKHVFQFHQVIDGSKNLLPSGHSKYVLYMWLISKHALRQAARGQQQHNEFMALLQQFVAELNERYPFDQDVDGVSCDKTPNESSASEMNWFD